MSGFIALHRDAFSHPVLKDGDRFRAWFWLVANAAWKPTKHDARGRTITVERGQICAGREHLAKEWKWSPSAVERFLTRLETEHMIERETGQGKSVITICNYDKYQDAPDQAGHMSGQQTGQKPDRNRTAKEQGNKETRLEGEEAKASPPPRAKRAAGSRIPEGWKPKTLPPTVASLVAQWPPGRLDRELEAFGDYWTARIRDACRADWDLTWHNRIRDIHDRILRDNRNGSPRHSEQHIAPSGRTMGRTEAAARAAISRAAPAPAATVARTGDGAAFALPNAVLPLRNVNG